MITARLIPLCSFIMLLAATSCDRMKNQAQETITETGETVGQGTTEFIGGVSRGIDKASQSSIVISDELAKEGLKVGKFFIADSAETRPYQLTAYLIFEKDFDEDVNVKIYDRQGQEYGRVLKKIEGKKGQARYFDFVFDRRTAIEPKSTFRFEKE